jgi:hypothetical protein
MFPGLKADEDLDTTTRKKHIGEEYYRDAMQVKSPSGGVLQGYHAGRKYIRED